MSGFLDKAIKLLWQIVEVLFAFLLVVVLIGLYLGKNAGGFVQSVMQNVSGFVNSIAPGPMIGIAVLLVLLYIAKAKWNR